MDPKENKSKFNYLNPIPNIEKKTFNRLAGIVSGARVDLTGERNLLFQILPPFVILLIYFFSAMQLVQIIKEEVYYNTPIIFLLTLPLSLIPKIGSYASYVVFIFFFTLGGLLWYLLLREFSGRVFVAFLTVILWVSPLFSFSPSGTFSIPSQLFLGFLAYDIPHIIGLSITALPLHFLIRFLRSPRYKYLIWTVISFTIILLISPFAYLNLIFFSVIFCASEILLGSGRIKLVRYLLIILFSCLLASFWYHPSFLLNLLRSSQWSPIIATFTNLVPLSFFIIPITGTVLFLVFDRKPQLQTVFTAICLVIIYGMINFSENFLARKLVPLPVRFSCEFSLGLSLLIAVILSNLYFFAAVISIKIKKSNSIWLERLPYALSSFALGLILTWTVLAINNNRYYLNYGQADKNKNISVLMPKGGDNWFKESGGLISHLFGGAISIFAIVFLGKLRYKFKQTLS